MTNNASMSELFNDSEKKTSHAIDTDVCNKNESANDEELYIDYQTDYEYRDTISFTRHQNSASNDSHYVNSTGIDNTDNINDYSNNKNVMSSVYIKPDTNNVQASLSLSDDLDSLTSNNRAIDSTSVDYSDQYLTNANIPAFDFTIEPSKGSYDDAVSERIFMSSLVKHTLIALIIIIPLAAYSAYAATSLAPTNSTFNLQHIKQKTYNNYRQTAQIKGYNLSEFNSTTQQGQTVNLEP